MAFGAFGAAPATTAAEAPRKRSPIALFLLLPGALYLALFFLVPLISLVVTSLQETRLDGDFGEYQYALNWQNYVDVLEAYWPHIIRSFGYALAATVFALLIGYPLAYVIGVKLRRWRMLQAIALTLVIAPFFISFLLRTLAWKQILSDEGPVVTFFQALSILPPDAHLTGTPFSVIFGLTYFFNASMTPQIYTSLERLDLRYVEAIEKLTGKPIEWLDGDLSTLSLPAGEDELGSVSKDRRITT